MPANAETLVSVELMVWLPEAETVREKSFFPASDVVNVYGLVPATVEPVADGLSWTVSSKPVTTAPDELCASRCAVTVSPTSAAAGTVHARVVG